MKKPLALKLISGTDQPCRRDDPGSLMEIPIIMEVPEPPHWLPNEHAIAEWRKLAPIFVNNGLLTETSISVLGNLCALHGVLVDVWSKGFLPNANTIAQYRSMVNDFGMTPASLSKVKINKDTPKANKFSSNGKR